MKKYNKNEWIVAIVIFPIIWICLLIKYLTGDGCFRGGGKIACGENATLIVIAWFLFCMAFPYLYFFKVLPEIKRQETEDLQKTLADEFNKNESEKNNDK